MKKSLKLRNMPIGKLLFSMSVPAMFSMLIQALYNIIDSIYVSKLGPTAFNAVNLAFPMQVIVMAFALGIGIGTNSLISRKLGEGKHEEASQVAKHGIYLSIIVGIAFVIIGLLLSKPFISIMTYDKEAISLGSSYLYIVLGFSIISIIEITLTKILQGVGNMIVPMFAQLLGAITNIILDPIFIFDLGLGVKGAAIATIIGQTFALLLVLSIFVFKKQEISISIKNFKFNKHILYGIFNVGLPVTIMNSIASFTTTILNALLTGSYTDPELGKAAVNVLGVYFKLQSFVFMPVFGLTQGAMPILGYNYGANLKARFYKTIKLMFITGFSIILIGFAVFQLIPEKLLGLFHPDKNMISIGNNALRIISLCFIPASFGIIMSNIFQSIGHGIKSLLMSLLRQIILLIPFAIILSSISPDIIWFSYGLAETITAIIFIPICLITVKKVFVLKNQNLNILTEE